MRSILQSTKMNTIKSTNLIVLSKPSKKLAINCRNKKKEKQIQQVNNKT